jgi:hypothetical protein
MVAEITEERPATEPADAAPGAAVLDEARAFVARFAVLPSGHHLDAVTLWAAHTHAAGAFTTSPRLALLSSEPGSGKTRVLDLLALLCARARLELDPTGPAVAAMIAAEMPTLLLDETDTIFGARGSANAKRQLRGILNSGYRAGALLTRSAGRDGYQSVPVYCPVAFAGLGNLPDTLMSRSVIVRMRKRRPGERTDAYLPRMHAPLGQAVGEALGQWCKTVTLDLATAWPELPEGVQDRAAEVWEPLLAVADAAGGHWPATARAACRAIALDAAEDAGPTPASRLLADLAAVWPRTGGEPARYAATADLLTALYALDGAPWRTLWEPGAAPRELAAMLAARGITPRKVRVSAERTAQGYQWSAIGGEQE